MEHESIQSDFELSQVLQSLGGKSQDIIIKEVWSNIIHNILI